MPRGDGTGPNGAGTMTGRGAGYCAGFSVPGFVGGGRGRGMRLGKGLRMGNESVVLKNQAKYLSKALNSVNKRMTDLHTAT
jgi:hypothetical protein